MDGTWLPDDSTAINPSICCPRSPFMCLVLENDTALLCCYFHTLDDFNLTVTVWESASWNQETETASFHHTSGDVMLHRESNFEVGKQDFSTAVEAPQNSEFVAHAWQPDSLCQEHQKCLAGGDSKI